MKTISTLTASLLLPLCAQAEITLPSFFSNGMVLQRQTEAKLWGKTTPNTKITATLGEVKATSKSAADGAFSISFKGLKANTKGQPLTLTTPSEKKVIDDVLIGEVWLASGQSNMEWTMNRSDGAEEAKTAKDPLLRVYVSRNVAIGTPQANFVGSWKPTQPGNTQGFTAVGYQFAKQLRKELNVPVGIIECAWGGKPVESFISEEAIAKLPEAKNLVGMKSKRLAGYKKALAKFKEAKKTNPKAKAPADPNRTPNLHSNIYNGMIAPLVGYGIKGAIWYQGESNANPNSSSNYAELQDAMVQDWRTRWGHPLSFYYVQLANFTRRSPEQWIIVQDEQRQMLETTKNTGMAVINDIGHPTNIHPKNKTDVGKRLSLWALKNDYGKKDIIPSGPLYASQKVKANNIELSFTYSDGLKSKNDKPLATFEISGAYNQWHPATATIKGQKIILTSPKVKQPTKARYAWNINPTEANLTNSTGLPASCFTTQP